MTRAANETTTIIADKAPLPGGDIIPESGGAIASESGGGFVGIGRLPAVRERDMPLWLRCHVPLCVAFESVSVAGVRRGGGASWREARVLARGVRASFKLIEATGHPVYPRAKRLIYRSPLGVVAAMLWSMSRVRSFRELLASGGAECVALVQAMATDASLARRGDLVEAVVAMAPSRKPLLAARGP